MTADQCVFCGRSKIVPRESGGIAFDCDGAWDYTTKLRGHLDEDILIHYLSAWCGPIKCSFYKPVGTGLYSQFFRYIYIALKRGRDTQ